MYQRLKTSELFEAESPISVFIKTIEELPGHLLSPFAQLASDSYAGSQGSWRRPRFGVTAVGARQLSLLDDGGCLETHPPQGLVHRAQHHSQVGVLVPQHPQSQRVVHESSVNLA